MHEHRRRILVLDDAPEFLEFMSAVLTDSGYTALTASTLAGATALLHEWQPRLIISESRLAGHRPFECVETLRADRLATDVPIVVCTGDVLAVEARREQLEAPGFAVLLKPFDIDDLLELVGRLSPAPSAVDARSLARECGQ